MYEQLLLNTVSDCNNSTNEIQSHIHGQKNNHESEDMLRDESELSDDQTDISNGRKRRRR